MPSRNTPGGREHWQQVYQGKAPDQVSWFQPLPAVSLELIAATGIDKGAGIVDVGGGASTLVDSLLDAGYRQLAVLDLSAAALAHSRERLGPRVADIEWIEHDVRTWQPPSRFGLWHDRAAFHFLTDPGDRAAYVATMQRALSPGGTAIIATFAPDGPPKCSGLEVIRYDRQAIQAELGPGFRLLEERGETHRTPWGAEQRFNYFRFSC